jgi:dihydrofolate reductase
MFRLIAAIDRRRGIAKGGFQPWYIPEEQQYFKKQTLSMGATVLVGSTSFKRFKNGPLADRKNYVLTHDKAPIEGVELVHDLEKFLRDWQDKDVWIIGGADVFAQVMELGRADELYLTHIEADFGCHQFFPPYDDYMLVKRSDMREQNGFIFTFAKYTANKS